MLTRGQKLRWGKVEGNNEEWMLVGAEDAVVIAAGWFVQFEGGPEGGK